MNSAVMNGTHMTDTEPTRCSSCGANNRVPREKIEHGLQPVCGRCKTPLVISSAPLTITDANFSAEVERSPLPVLLDMWAPWCGPCKMIAPAIEQLAAREPGASARREIECRRKSGDCGTLQRPQHSRSSGV
jgi:thioredoxin 2